MPEPSDWLDSIGQSETCANCGASSNADFCSECGQKRLQHRLRFFELMGEMFSRLFNHERGIFFTFWSMLVRPGQVARDYISGKQKKYVSPLAFYFLGAATQLLSLWINLDHIRASTIESFDQQMAMQPPNVMESLKESFGDNVVQTFVDSYLSAIQQGYTYVALFCFCLPWALLLYGGNRLWGTRYRLAETVVFALYTFGQMLILTAIEAVILVRWNLTAHGLFAIGIYLLFPLWAHRHFFPSTATSWLTTFVTTVISCSIFVVGIVLVFIASILSQALIS